MNFTNRATNIPNSGIGYMMRYASKYPDVISLGQGTPLFPTPQFIYDQLYKLSKINSDLGMYSGPKIENPLKKLIIKQVDKLYGYNPKSSEILLTVGGIAGLFTAIMSLVQKGDEVIYFDPSYPLHIAQIHIAEAKPVFVSYDENNNWSIDIEKLKKAITKNTKIIILTNPNNPTGTVVSEQEVKQLAEIILKNNLILVLDEAYDFLTYGKILYSPAKLPELRNNIIVCKSFSKEFAMTGWRIGYALAPEEIITKMAQIHTHFSISPSTPSIVAATIALSDKKGEEAKQDFIKKFTESRKTICDRLDRLQKLFSYNKPDGAYYVFPKYLNFKVNSLEFAKLLVDEAKVITIPGSSMGPSGEGHLRMSFAANATVINKAFDCLDEFAKKHNLL